MTAISRSRVVNIYIADAGTNASALASSDAISGEIKSYSKSGGDQDVESDAVFGGFVDKEKPREQVEVSLEIIPSLENADRWDALAYGADTTLVYTMAGQTTDKAVFIDADSDGAGANPKSWGFNNCQVVVLDIDHNADDNQSLNMNLKFSPTNGSNVSNFMTYATGVESLPAWTALDNN